MEIISIIVVVIILLAIIFRKPNHIIQYEKLLSVDEYLDAHPECKTDSGIQCVKCQSKSIRNFGYECVTDKRRRFICNHCGTNLYRINDPEENRKKQAEKNWQEMP